MFRRKLQIIAGSTYTLSLPKDWVKKNKLKEGDELLIDERHDKTLCISLEDQRKQELSDIEVDVEKSADNIDQILFAIYYLGIENINLFSKIQLAPQIRARIRRTLSHMSGTEIIHEDKNKISIKVLLDKNKVDLIQTLYRMSLIIEQEISNINEDFDILEIRASENEVDRLYHLAAKIITISMTNSSLLNTSNIKNLTSLPSFFLIAKKLENIADNINNMSEHMVASKANFPEKREILIFIKTELNRAMRHALGGFKGIYEKSSIEKVKALEKILEKAKDRAIVDYLQDTLRYLVDINEEIVNISFYKQVIE